MSEEEQVFCVGDGTDMFMAGFSVMSNNNDSNDTDNPLVQPGLPGALYYSSMAENSSQYQDKVHHSLPGGGSIWYSKPSHTKEW